MNEEQKIVTGSYDNTIKIWDANSLELISTLIESDSVERLFYLKHEEFACCPRDFNINIWNTSTSKQIQTLKKHTHFVLGFELFSTDVFLSGSHDNSLVIWKRNKNNQFECHFTYVSDHQKGCRTIVKLSDSFIICSSDSDINVYAIDRVGTNYQLIFAHTLSGHSENVRILKLVGETKTRLLSGSQDKNCKLWDLQNKSCLQTFSAHSHWIHKILVISENIFISVSKEIKIWRIGTEECHTISYKDGSNEICCLMQMGNAQLFTAGQTKSLELWKY
jgi:WD40 repeat protein